MPTQSVGRKGMKYLNIPGSRKEDLMNLWNSENGFARKTMLCQVSFQSDPFKGTGGVKTDWDGLLTSERRTLIFGLTQRILLFLPSKGKN
jgi:hypothetical protein